MGYYDGHFGHKRAYCEACEKTHALNGDGNFLRIVKTCPYQGRRPPTRLEYLMRNTVMLQH